MIYLDSEKPHAINGAQDISLLQMKEQLSRLLQPESHELFFTLRIPRKWNRRDLFSTAILGLVVCARKFQAIRDWLSLRMEGMSLFGPPGGRYRHGGQAVWQARRKSRKGPNKNVCAPDVARSRRRSKCAKSGRLNRTVLFDIDKIRLHIDVITWFQNGFTSSSWIEGFLCRCK
jgi:hypothetical protein